MIRSALLTFCCAMAAFADLKVIATVVDAKTGKPVTGLSAGDFLLTDDKASRRVKAAEPGSELLDVMLMLDTSLIGGAVTPVAQELIGQLKEKEQMAIASFDSSANLVQDFTSSRELLSRALGSVKYGNAPRVLDGLYAVLDGGFQSTTFRRVILLVTTGIEGPSRTPERDVIRLAQRNGVSIYPIFLSGIGRSLFELLARRTGGASLQLRDLAKDAKGSVGPRIFETVRAHYVLTIEGNLAMGERAKLEVRGREKDARASMLLLD